MAEASHALQSSEDLFAVAEAGDVASVNIHDEFGTTPLHFAEANARPSVPPWSPAAPPAQTQMTVSVEKRSCQDHFVS